METGSKVPEQSDMVWLLPLSVALVGQMVIATSISKSRNCLALAIAPKSKHKIEDCFEGSMPTFIFFLFKVDPLASFCLQVCLFLAVQ